MKSTKRGRARARLSKGVLTENVIFSNGLGVCRLVPGAGQQSVCRRRTRDTTQPTPELYVTQQVTSPTTNPVTFSIFTNIIGATMTISNATGVPAAGLILATPSPALSVNGVQAITLNQGGPAAVATYDAVKLTLTGGVMSTGNPHSVSSVTLDSFVVDTVAPVILASVLSSNNPTPIYAKPGNIVELVINTDEDIREPVVVFTSGGDSLSIPPIYSGSAPPVTWTVSQVVAAADTDGVIALSMTLTDLAGNITNSTAFTGGPITVDTTVPTLVVNGTTPSVENANPNLLVMKFSENIATGTPTFQDFTVEVNSTQVTLTGANIVAGDVTLDILTAIVNGQDVTVAYTKSVTPGQNIGDAAGNAVETFTAQIVQNNVL